MLYVNELVFLRYFLINNFRINNLKYHYDSVLIQIVLHLLVFLFRLLKLSFNNFLMGLLNCFSFGKNIRKRKVNFRRSFWLAFIFLFLNRFRIFILIYLTIFLSFFIQINNILFDSLVLLLINFNLLQRLRWLDFTLLFLNRNRFWINLLNLSLLYLLNWSCIFSFHF